MSTDKPTPERKHLVETAAFWFKKARHHQELGPMNVALLAMENAYNHVENALAATIAERDEYARQLAEARQNECAAQKGAERNAIVNRGLAELNAQLRAELTALRSQDRLTCIRKLRTTIESRFQYEELSSMDREALEMASEILGEHTPAEETKP